jgi:hypothetical protein
MRAVMINIIEAVMRNRYEKSETREVMLKINPEGKHDDANKVRKRGNVRQQQEDQLNMYKKTEMRETMSKIRPDGKHDEVRERDNVRQGQAEQLLQVIETSFRVRTLAIKFVGGSVFENTLDKDPGKDKAHEKAEKRVVVVDINSEDICMNNVVKKQLYVKPNMRDEMLKTTPKGKHDEDMNMNDVLDENNTAVSTKNPQLYKDSSYPYSRELNLHEKRETRDEMLKTTPTGKHD